MLQKEKKSRRDDISVTKDLIVIAFACCFLGAFAAPPERKALMGIKFTPKENGLHVDSVIPNSTASALKLNKNDLILSINGLDVKDMQTYVKAAGGIRAKDKLIVKVKRDSKELTVSGKAVMRPYETSDIADINYDWVKFKNGALRTITRKPKGKTNVPCILLIPGYGCGSIENYSGSYNGKLMNEWLKKGYGVVTIEKSGLGDSFDCEPCSEADLRTDIESFDAGYTYMENLSWVNKTQLFIWGHSLGGMVAPEIAKKHQPKGVMVFGTVFRPWSEFLLEMHRVQKPLLDGLNYEQTETFTRLIQKVYYEFFVVKKSREELHNNPEYKAIVESELGYKPNDNDMWGRHWRFWQQIDTLNLANSWSSLNCPVLVINGGADYEQCAPIEPLLIEKTVNQAHPNNATRVQIEDLDHFMMKSNSFEEAVKNFNTQQYAKGNFNMKIADTTLEWLNKINK
jgi:pimeloyl-ACP methyl ester carboxylesterase